MSLKARRFVMNPWAVLVLGIGAIVMLSPWTAQACSVCGGSALGTDPGTGFNSSILFLLAMPYVVVGAIGGWLIYTYRRGVGTEGKKGVRPPLTWTQKESEK